ncbi:hypothetical protein R6U77_00805 [Lysinibacillus louembei]|uniref:Uncharacterized protein n=1 Tax=Lysinibacillus louembei TaxID=1470088 RepID=A0ABZ0RZN1_9BACI|nr:hypothetical protein [Lysinibacillus louembei]WPK12258.1 hypothetical protein R6U77_00805 [Lysinibacillus louembei]
MYKYFVSYNYAHGSSLGFGHTEISRGLKVRGIDDIRAIARDIEGYFSHEKGSVTVLNFRLFDEE